MFSKNNITKNCSNFVWVRFVKTLQMGHMMRHRRKFNQRWIPIFHISQWFSFFSPCYLLLLLIIVFRYNTLTVQQYTFTLFQSSLLSSSLVPGSWSLYDCHHNHYHDKYKFPGNFFYGNHQVWQGGEKGDSNTLHGRQVSVEIL